ncbi:MAG: hypothetical protein WB760_26440 [Xanthobacteraceae bacterium]
MKRKRYRRTAADEQLIAELRHRAEKAETKLEQLANAANTIIRILELNL